MIVAKANKDNHRFWHPPRPVLVRNKNGLTSGAKAVELGGAWSDFSTAPTSLSELSACLLVCRANFSRYNGNEQTGHRGSSQDCRGVPTCLELGCCSASLEQLSSCTLCLGGRTWEHITALLGIPGYSTGSQKWLVGDVEISRMMLMAASRRYSRLCGVVWRRCATND